MKTLILPSTIRVAAFDVAVIPWENHAAAASRSFGEWSPVEMAVRVDATMSPMKILDTLLHEINHAVCWAYGIRDEDKEERIVGTMATAWAQIYRDNPDLVQWIAEIVVPLGEPTPCSVLPHVLRSREYVAWRERLAAGNRSHLFTAMEDAVSHSAFIAGWYLRNSEDPDAFTAMAHAREDDHENRS